MSFLKRLFGKKEEPEQMPQGELHMPFPVQLLAMPEDEIDAEELWQKYQHCLREGKQEGYVPVLLRMNDILQESIEMNLPEGESHLPLSDVGDGKAWLDRTYRAILDEIPEAEQFLFAPTEVSALELHRPLSLDQELRSETPLYLAKIPAKHPWEVAAWLPFGGWNACPAPEEMMAVLKYWHEKYGAIPVCIGSDAMEIYVPEPVSEADALELAKEQYAFCNDLVEQGVESITALAAGLKDSNIWFFWWD